MSKLIIVLFAINGVYFLINCYMHYIGNKRLSLYKEILKDMKESKNVS